MEHFKAFENLDSIDRKIAATLIKRIKITGKRKIEIEFNYMTEYEAALVLLRKEAA